MRLYFVFTLVAAAALSSSASADESAATALQCRAQVVFDCDKTCEARNQPADPSLDFKAKSGSFCRGEKCDDATLTSVDIPGQWDAEGYTAFAALAEDRAGFRARRQHQPRPPVLFGAIG